MGPGPLRDAIVMFMFVSAASRAALARGDGISAAWEEKLGGVDPRAALYTGVSPSNGGAVYGGHGAPGPSLVGHCAICVHVRVRVCASARMCVQTQAGHGCQS